MVYRIYVEKKQGFDLEARICCAKCASCWVSNRFPACVC